MKTDKKITEKTLVIVRHAKRDADVPELDNGLNEQGQEQAQRLLAYFKKHYHKSGTPPFLMSSPRLRCRETLAPIALVTGVSLKIEPLLNEGQRETRPEIEKRTHDFKKWWQDEGPEFCIICSHGDWIPHFLDATIDQALDVRKGGLAELHLKAGKIHLRKILDSREL